jgi:hypothetical protein
MNVLTGCGDYQLHRTWAQVNERGALRSNELRSAADTGEFRFDEVSPLLDLLISGRHGRVLELRGKAGRNALPDADQGSDPVTDIIWLLARYEMRPVLHPHPRRGRLRRVVDDDRKRSARR